MHVHTMRTAQLWPIAPLMGATIAAVVAAVFSPIAAVGLVALTLFFVFLSRPKIALYGAVVLFPIIHFKPVAGVKLSEMFLLIIFAAALLQVISGKQRLKAAKPVAYLLLFIGICAASFVNSIGIPKDRVTYAGLVYSPNIICVGWIMRYLMVALILLVVPWLVDDKSDLRKLIGVHITAGTMASLFGLGLVALFFLGKPVNIPICRNFGGYAGMWGPRLTGTAFEPAGFACYLLSVIPVTMAAWIGEQDGKKKLLLYVAFAVQCLAMLFTLSSGGWVALAILLPILAYRLRRRLDRTKKIGLAMFVVLPALLFGELGASGLLPASRAAFVLIGKFTTDTPGKSDRIGTGRILLRMARDHPLLGIGPGNFVYLLASYAENELSLSDAGYQQEYPATWRANNDYFTIAAETGVTGLIVFLLFLGTVLGLMNRTLKMTKGGGDETLIAGIYVAVVALLMQAFVSFNMLNPFGWTLVAIAYGYQRSLLRGRRATGD